VQVVVWYEGAVKARSRDHAIANAEGVQSEYIQSVGVAVAGETGLADPESVRVIVTA